MRFLSLDAGGTAIKAGLTTPDGAMNLLSELPSEAKQGGQHFVERICKTIARYDPRSYDCIGISSTGQVDVSDGHIVFANENVPQYTGMPLRDLVQEAFHKPVVVENDVNAAALGEAYYGAAKGERHFLCLTYGTGIGGAILMDGKLYRGSKGIAGEFGHLITHKGGLSCVCGQMGCYEQYASTTALVRGAMSRNPEWDNGISLFQAFHKGDSAAQEVVAAWIQEVVAGLVSLVHIFNPSCLVLGGGVMKEPAVVDAVDLLLHEKVMPSYRNMSVRRAELGNYAALLGMARLCTEYMDGKGSV